MAKTRKKNGDIFEVSLQPYLDAFAYVKYIDITKYNSDAKYPDILRVFDFISDKQIESIQEIQTRDLMMNPIYISGGYGVVKLFRFVGWEDIRSDELDFPHLRISIPDDAEDRNLPIVGWKVISPDYKVINDSPLPYEAVKHLDTPGLIINIDYLAYRISLEIFKRQSYNILDYFELDWYQHNILRRVNEMPNFSRLADSVLPVNLSEL